MASFKNKCVEYFGTSNLYEVLNLPKDATSKEIKKAYHKLSLIVHPDRVPENQKETATEKFKVLGKIHNVLQDKAHRDKYDETGELFDEDEDFNWLEYWKKMFKKIELQDIINYETEYIGSETELRDIKKAYVGTKGNMDKMLEMIPFSNCENEDRYKGIVRKMVEDGEVEEYDLFFKEPKAKKNRRHRKYALEKEESEKTDPAEIERFADDLRDRNQTRLADLLTNLEEKYGGKKRKAIKSGATKSKRTRSSK